MSFNKNSFALYWDYRIDSGAKQELTSKVKLALLEENWDLFHNQEAFVKNLPDKAKKALSILDRSGFRTPDVLKYFSDESEREIIQEAEQIILPAYEPIGCVVNDVAIIINFDWSHPTGQWVIHPLDENKNGFHRVVERLLEWDDEQQMFDWAKIRFTDNAIYITDSRANALQKGVNLIKSLGGYLQCDMFYSNRKNGQAKVTLPTDDYAEKLYGFAAIMDISKNHDRIFSRV